MLVLKEFSVNIMIFPKSKRCEAKKGPGHKIWKRPLWDSVAMLLSTVCLDGASSQFQGPSGGVGMGPHPLGNALTV